MSQNRQTIKTDRQLAWWLTRLRRRWYADDQYVWCIQVNTGHWSSLRLSDKMVRSLRGDGRQISSKYRARLTSAYADLPERLEIILMP